MNRKKNIAQTINDVIYKKKDLIYFAKHNNPTIKVLFN